MINELRVEYDDAEKLAVSHAIVEKLYYASVNAPCERSRLYAFMLLQMAAGQPPTLFR